MNSRSVWIERGPNGRPYFVRKKSDLPSARQLFAQLLLPRSARSLLFSRDSRQNQHVQGDNNGPQLALPASDSFNPQPTQPYHPPPMGPTSASQAQPVNMYLIPAPPDGDSAGAKDTNGISQHMMSQQQPPPPQYLAMPPPGMYPMPPFPATTYPLPPFNQPLQVPLQPPHLPPTGPGPLPVQNQPHGPLLSLPRPAVNPAHETRYKCDICGRFRSARYHYKHPIPPGQVPAKTICRKCRQEATDSEEDSSSDSFRSARRRDSSRGRIRRSISSRRAESRHSSRARSIGRQILADDDHLGRHAHLDAGSDSSDGLEDRLRGRVRRHRRPHSRQRDLVRYTRRLRLSPQGEQTFYENDHSSVRVEHGSNLEKREHDYEASRSIRSLSRRPRVRRGQYSDPFLARPQQVEYIRDDREYFEGPLHRGNQGRYSPQHGPSRLQSRRALDSGHNHAFTRRDHSTESHRYDREGRRYDQRSRSRSMSRGRHISRESSFGHQHVTAAPEEHIGLSTGPVPPWVNQDIVPQAGHTRRSRHAPSPPHDCSPPEDCLTEPDLGEWESHERRFERRRHHRHRSRTPEDDHFVERSLLRPGDEVTLIERRRERPSEDYDWYDEEGMRVRVREI